MSIPDIKPFLPDGKLPSTDPNLITSADYASWDDWDTADVVDAEVLQRNLAALVSHVNGNLNGTDVDLVNTPISETTFITQEESGAKTWPSVGQRHGHDGIDSRILASSIIGHTLLKDRIYSIFRCPSQLYRGLLLHGRVENDAPDGYDSANGWNMAVPFNSQSWGSYLSSARSGIFVSRIIPNVESLTWAERRTLLHPCVYKTISGDNITAMKIYQGSGQPTWIYLTVEATGMFHWAINGLV